MSRYKIRLYDEIFNHSFGMIGYYTASNLDRPERVEWTKTEQTDVCVFTESNFDDASNVDCKYKVAWLVESKGVHEFAYEKIGEIENNFDYILTHDKQLVNRSKNVRSIKNKKYHQVYVGSSRIDRSLIDINTVKTKMCSMIASNKTMTAGHMFRHQIASSFSNFDKWGSGYQYFTSKEDPLRPYMYSIVVMNAKYDYYFTEYLIDCFICKTIPIFWGCPSIGDIFDVRGMYVFDTIEELKNILDNMSESDYNSKLKYINKNYEIAKNKFLITDDIVFDKIKELCLVI